MPLKKLCDGTRLLRKGDYSARVDLQLKNEFAELQNTFNDMAARIEHEIALRQKSEEDRRRLILDISHDLKTPLSSIQGYAERLRQKSESASLSMLLRIFLNPLSVWMIHEIPKLVAVDLGFLLRRRLPSFMAGI
ncbi:MAG TPA: HAMP domain-containing protein [Clostridiaceae bacterium]|nr:HAMP domain-containing protein [Clostridiaceae bacterium]